MRGGLDKPFNGFRVYLRTTLYCGSTHLFKKLHVNPYYTDFELFKGVTAMPFKVLAVRVPRGCRVIQVKKKERSDRSVWLCSGGLNLEEEQRFEVPYKTSEQVLAFIERIVETHDLAFPEYKEERVRIMMNVPPGQVVTSSWWSQPLYQLRGYLEGKKGKGEFEKSSESEEEVEQAQEKIQEDDPAAAMIQEEEIPAAQQDPVMIQEDPAVKSKGGGKPAKKVEHAAAKAKAEKKDKMTAAKGKAEKKDQMTAAKGKVEKKGKMTAAKAKVEKKASQPRGSGLLKRPSKK